MIDNLLFTVDIVAPVFLIIALGFLLKKVKIINETFVTVTSKFVFNVSLPALIFMELYNIDFGAVVDPGQIIYVYIGTLVMFFAIWAISIPFIKDGKDLSVFVQGAYRSNYAIVGLAIISNLFGSTGLGKASLLLAFILPLYNILAVVILTVPMRKERKLNLTGTIKEIITNPLILAVITSLPFSYLKINLPDVIISTGNLLSDVALPLALIGIGGSMNFTHLKNASGLAFTSSAIKIVLIPLVLVFGAYEVGFRNTDLGILFVLFSAPTAVVSFIMAEAMGCNSRLAGNIVVISTIGSIVTISAAIILLRSIGLI